MKGCLWSNSAEGSWQQCHVLDCISFCATVAGLLAVTQPRTGVSEEALSSCLLLWPLLSWDLFKKPLSDLYCCDKLLESITFKRRVFCLALGVQRFDPMTSWLCFRARSMQWDSCAYLWWLGSKQTGTSIPSKSNPLPPSKQHLIYFIHAFYASSVMLKANYQLNINGKLHWGL